MITWVCILLYSAVAGVFCGIKFRGFPAVAAGAAVAISGILLWILFCEFVLPHQAAGDHKDGASLWPIAIFVAGTPAAMTGGIVALITESIKNSRPDERRTRK